MLGSLRVGCGGNSEGRVQGLIVIDEPFPVMIGNKPTISQPTYEKDASLCIRGSFYVYTWSSRGADALSWRGSSGVAVEES